MKSSPMAPRRKSFGQKSEPKLFRCTGFGDCDMVFTRSEHLARHARKHTGEKPYKCVVPGCERSFSRFDNMMQHTQTHNKPSNQKKDRRKSTSHIPSKKDHKHMAEFEKPTEFDRSNSIHPLSSSQWGSPQMSMISSRTLPLPRRMSYSYCPSPSSPMTPAFEPMPPPPALYYRRGSLQSTSSTSSSVSTEGRRRLSAADLQVPIQSFQETTLGSKDDEASLHPLAVVDISCDEYEALQGFSKFSSREQKNYSSDETDSDDALPSIQPNATHMFSSQVAAFRQNLMPIQESFQRPFKNQAM